MDENTIQQMVESRVKEAVKESQGVLLEEIRTMFTKISAHSSVVNKSSVSSILEIPKFKRKSNEEQFKQNSKVLEKLEQVGVAMQAEEYQVAHENITEGKIGYSGYFLFVLLNKLSQKTC